MVSSNDAPESKGLVSPTVNDTNAQATDGSSGAVPTRSAAATAAPSADSAPEIIAESPRAASPVHSEKLAANLNAKGKAGHAVIDQRQTIPTTGKRRHTTKWEYITFCLFYFSLNGAPIGNNGGGLRQALVNMKYPDGYLTWGGEYIPINAMLLRVQGVMFAAQLVTLMILGPYADYGNWRPWIMIVGQVLLYICQFSLCGISQPDQWEAAQALFVVGSLAANVVNSFYAATFPSIVRDLPKLIESEERVKAGTESPENHSKLDEYERAKLYNLNNMTGSYVVAVVYAIAVGMIAGIGYTTNEQKITSFRAALGYFGFMTVAFTVPFFILHKHRPGQQLPSGTGWLTAGPKQVWSAAKSAKKLKQVMLYLLAYFLLNETWGTYWAVTGIIQNDVIHYSPLMLNAFSLTADLCGGTGHLLLLILQKRFRFSVKQGVMFGAVMTLIPQLWGGIGRFTTKVGFHNEWEFWLVQAWNITTAAWGGYNVTMISEVVPGPKSYMFFALFNCVGKTSGFVGPFITAAIIQADGGKNNGAYWFLLGTGLLGLLTLYFVDTDQAKIDSAAYLAREAEEMYSEEQRAAAKHNLEESSPGTTTPTTPAGVSTAEMQDSEKASTVVEHPVGTNAVGQSKR
ncbi:hypothetical protein ACKVWC_001457 [Pyricularia oryzae]